MFSKIIWFLSIGVMLQVVVACESNVTINVKCVDAETKLPIDSVLVNVNAGKNGDYEKSTDSGTTNADGVFETAIMIGCSGGCYDIYMTYVKEGYEARKDLNLTEGTIELYPINAKD